MSLPPLVSAPHFTGRALELEQLADALRSARPGPIVVRGAPGAGKSALIAEAMSRARANGALVGAAKHGVADVGNGDEALFAALEQAVEAGLDCLYDPEGALAALAALMGAGASVLAGYGRGPFRRLNSDASPAGLNVEAAEVRRAAVAMRVLRWLQGFQQPVILALDDWGRVGPEMAALYRRLCADRSLTFTRVIASERPDEPIDGIDASVIQLGEFSVEDTRHFIAAKLGPLHHLKGEVAALIDASCVKLTPLELANHVRRIAEAGCFAFEAGRWRLDAARARIVVDVGDGGNIFQQPRLREAPATVAVAQCLALMERAESVSELSDAARVSMGDAADAIERLTGAGLVCTVDGLLTFTHDTFPDAVLARIDGCQRIDRADAIAEALRRHGADPGAVGRGAQMLRLRLEGDLARAEPALWEQAFLSGALSARRRGDRRALHDFSVAAFSLAQRRTHFDYAIWREAAHTAIEQGGHIEALELVTTMQENAREPIERAEADELEVYARRMSGDLEAAINAARRALGRIGIAAPRRGFSLNTFGAFARVLAVTPHWARKQTPLAASELAHEAPTMRAVHALGSLMFERSPLLAAGFLARSISPRLAAGSAAGAAGYAVICGSLGLPRRAAAWAKLSDARQSPQQPLRAASMLYATNLGAAVAHSSAALAARRTALIDLALEQGELSVALYAMRSQLQDMVLAGTPLAETALAADDACELARRVRDPGISLALSAVRQLVDNLQSPRTGGAMLMGSFFDRDQPGVSDILKRAANTYRVISGLEATLAAAFGDYDQLNALFDRDVSSFKKYAHQAQSQVWIFSTSLGLMRRGRRPPRAFAAALRRFAKLDPDRHAYRALLHDAEIARLAGRTNAALDLYQRSLAGAHRAGALLEAGMIARAGKQGAALMGIDAAYFDGHADAVWQALGAHALLQQSAEKAVLVESDILLDLEAARRGAEQANAARSRLLAAVGHELRTPLQALRAIAELGDAERPERRAMLMTAVEHMNAAIEDLTQLAISESGALAVALAPVDIADTLNAVGDIARLSLPDDRGLDVEYETTRACDGMLLGDGARLRQVLTNLVSNAVKYGKGRVRLSAHRRALPDGSVEVRFDVDDEGQARPPAEWAVLFEPFERGASGANGLGLGLSIARKVAAALGGALNVCETEYGSTRFRFTIALAKAAEAALAAPARVAAGVRVLLAEDEPMSRQLIAALLAREGASVDEVESGEDALCYARERTYDVVLLDARMGNLSGLDVADRLAEMAPTAKLALMSAAVDAQMAARAATLGVTCLRKPIGAAELRALLGDANAGPEALPSEEDETPMPTADAMSPSRDDVRCEANRLLEHIGAAYADQRVDEAAALSHRLMGLCAQFGLAHVMPFVAPLEAPAVGFAFLGHIENARLALFEGAH